MTTTMILMMTMINQETLKVDLHHKDVQVVEALARQAEEDQAHLAVADPDLQEVALVVADLIHQAEETLAHQIEVDLIRRVEEVLVHLIVVTQTHQVEEIPVHLTVTDLAHLAEEAQVQVRQEEEVPFHLIVDDQVREIHQNAGSLL